ncbi:MAG: hypothetical protein FJ146_17100 [Deltaproteobacteria bacterium]|nr:hypothetical protein [Deltaproteobacteria bacterium]
MARNKQISRIYNILIILEYAPHGLTVKALCNRLNSRGHEVGVRTVYRDLLALQAAGFPLSEHGTDADNATRWSLARKSKITQVGAITQGEMIVLNDILLALINHRDDRRKEEIKSLAAKMVSQMNMAKGTLSGGLDEGRICSGNIKAL